MKNRHVAAFISSALSIGPMVLLILAIAIGMSFVPYEGSYAKFTTENYILLALGGVGLIAGLGLFQIGASSSLTKVGKYMGSSLSRQSNLFVIIVFALALGTLITCAEPSILIVAKQVSLRPACP